MTSFRWPVQETAGASEFEAGLEIRGEERFGYQVLTVSSTAVPTSIAAICLAMRDEFGLIPHVYFDWTEGSPLTQFLRFILWGSGEVAPVTREILRRAEPDRSRRPHVHAGSGPAGSRDPATPELQPCRYWLTLPGEGS